jgi:hypothetical protein
MNHARRNKIAKAYNLLSECAEEEQMAIDEVPENLQGTEAYEQMEQNASVLETIVTDIMEISGIELHIY